MLTLSVGLHGGAALYGWMVTETQQPVLLPFKKAVATVSLQRTTVKPEEVAPPLAQQVEPLLAELPLDSLVKSPLKRSAAEIPSPPVEVPPPDVLAKAIEQPLPIEPLPMEPLPEETPLAPPPEMPVPRQTQAPTVPEIEAPIEEFIQEASVATAGDEIAPPTALTNPRPVLPPRYQNQGLKGVEFSLVIGTDGRVKQCTLIKSSGVAALDQEHAEFVRKQWVFQPATRGGQPVESRQPMFIRYDKQ